MKALVKSHAKEGIWLEDVSEPDVGNNLRETEMKTISISANQKLGSA